MKFSSWAQYYKHKPIGIGDYLQSLAGHAALFDEILRFHPRRILEIGSGTGIMPTFLSWLGYDLFSLDNDKVVLEDAVGLTRALNGKCNYVLGDAFALSEQFTKDSVDVIFSQGFFEHFSDDEINGLLHEQLAVAPIAVISVPSKYYGDRDFGNERLMLASDWRELLSEFPHVAIQEYHPKKRSLSSILRKGLTNPRWLIPWQQNEHLLITVERN